MKEYLLLFRGGDGKNLRQSPEKWQQHMQRWATWMGEMTQQGKFVGAQPLSNDGKQITGTKKTVTDGPFIEAKEGISGYDIILAENLEQATAIAQSCPMVLSGFAIREVRPMQPFVSPGEVKKDLNSLLAGNE